jgi:rhodanese-related sulfurtransferase
MFTWFAALSTNRRLAFSAFVLGAGALFASVDHGRALALHEKELATAVQREVDHVDPATLAGWIIQGKSDYRLIDLRDAAGFATYHIPTAENVPVASLGDGSLQRNETLVLYSDGGIHAAQAWMLLKAMGYRGVVTLRGGLQGWKDEVLFPVLPPEPTPQEQARFERAAAVAAFFGGQTRKAGSGDALALESPALPTVQAPALPAGAGPAGPPKRKKKEGC